MRKISQFQLRRFIVQSKLREEAGVIDRLEFGYGRARHEKSVEHHAHLVDVGTGEVIEFYHA